MKQDQETTNKSAGRLIGELSRAAHIYFQHEFQKYSIGHAQISTLLFITRNEGISQLEIAEQLNLDKSSITSQLQLLEKNGYISRRKCKNDARMHRLYITENTKNILEPLKKVFSAWTEILLDGFNEEEKTELFNYLERIRDNAKKEVHRNKENKEG